MGGDRGQASLELLGALPLLFLGFLATLQVSFGYATVSATDSAARAAARAESRGLDVRQAARDAVPGWLADDVDVSVDHEVVTVRTRMPIVMPLPGLPSGPAVRRSAYFPSER